MSDLKFLDEVCTWISSDKPSHTMSCEYPEGCSCGAGKVIDKANSLLIRLYALKRRLQSPETLEVSKADNDRDKLWCTAILSVGLDMRDIEKIVSKALDLRTNPEAREYLEIPDEIYARFRPTSSVDDDKKKGNG